MHTRRSGANNPDFAVQTFWSLESFEGLTFSLTLSIHLDILKKYLQLFFIRSAIQILPLLEWMPLEKNT